MYTYKAYFIETLTNTMVGAGDTTIGLADKEIQKDPITSCPVFHSHSIKGAIKDHFQPLVACNNQPKGSKKLKLFTFNSVFGAPESHDMKELKEKFEQELSDNEIDQAEYDKNCKEYNLLKEAPKHGLIKFFQAHLLTLPMRASRNVYYNCTCPMLVLDFLKDLINLNVELIHRDNNSDETEYQEKVKQEIENISILKQFFENIASELKKSTQHDFIVFGENNSPETPMEIEEFDKGKFIELPEEQEAQITEEGFCQGFFCNQIKSILQTYLTPLNTSPDFINTIAVFPDEVFKEICETDLPIIARNCLEEGNENLFYEEVLPKRSVMRFITGTYNRFNPKDHKKFADSFNFFEKILVDDKIQMGANESVGYGVTSISRVKGGA